MLENARNNDQLFDTTQNLVLALLGAADATEIAEIAQRQLSNHANVDACEFIVVEQEGLDVASTVRTQSSEHLKTEFEDLFRLKRTHCGSLDQKTIVLLFQNEAASIRSTALCPVISNGEVLAILALGNQRRDTFSVNLDTLFLDFIGHVIGAVLVNIWFRRRISERLVCLPVTPLMTARQISLSNLPHSWQADARHCA